MVSAPLTASHAKMALSKQIWGGLHRELTNFAKTTLRFACSCKAVGSVSAWHNLLHWVGYFTVSGKGKPWPTACVFSSQERTTTRTFGPPAPCRIDGADLLNKNTICLHPWGGLPPLPRVQRHGLPTCRSGLPRGCQGQCPRCRG